MHAPKRLAFKNSRFLRHVSYSEYSGFQHQVEAVIDDLWSGQDLDSVINAANAGLYADGRDDEVTGEELLSTGIITEFIPQELAEEFRFR